MFQLKNKKAIAMIMCGTMAVSVALTGCGSSTSSSSSAESTENVSSVELESATIMGTVESVDGDTITVDLSQDGPGGAPGSESGESDSTADADSKSSDDTKTDDSSDTNSDDAKADDSSDASADDAKSDDSSDASSDDAKTDDNSDANSDDTKSDSDSANTDSSDNSENSDNPPAKPDGDSSSDSEGSDKSSGEAPSGEKPSGEAPSGEKPSGDAGEAPSGDGQMSNDNDKVDTDEVTITVNDESVLKDSDGEEADVDDVKEGDMIRITYDEDGNISEIVLGGGGPGGNGGNGAPGGGQSSAPTSYDSATEITEDTETSGETYSSTGTDENALLTSNGANVTIDSATVTKESDDSTGGDDSSFYGIGAAVLNTDATTVIKNSTITTDSQGGAGVFSYGDGVTYVSDTKITTTQDTSGGLHVAGGGTLYAWDNEVETNGESSAAIRSDRGGGSMVVDGGTYTSNGTGSPAVYCTADIVINNAKLTSNASEGVCIEGLNTLRLFDSDLTSTMSSDDRNDVIWNIIVYQSQSGDSEEGNGTFSMTGGSITASEGGIFYTTNTESTFYLNDVDITYPEDNAFFLQATGNTNTRGWGTAGSNGADTSFTADNQDMEGNVIYDSISNLDFYMENGSTLKGAIVDDETYAGNGGSGEANVYISSDSTWTVTGDSTVTNLYNEGKIVDADGNTVTIVDTDGNTIVEGTSEYKVTVSSYSTTADFSGASTEESFSTYAVEEK